jgi:hypothetical protein
MTDRQDRTNRLAQWEEEERRLREAALLKAVGAPPDPEVEEAEDAAEEGARARIDQQTLWVDRQVRAAMARGEFDNLPGAGKPLRLPSTHDPDWWVKGLVEREKITAVLPPALGLRREDAELEAELDRLATPDAVRHHVEDFNRRVVEARRQLQGGPPVVTPTRDVESEVEAWRERRAARRRTDDNDSSAKSPRETPHKAQTNRWWRWRRH